MPFSCFQPFFAHCNKFICVFNCILSFVYTTTPNQQSHITTVIREAVYTELIN